MGEPFTREPPTPADRLDYALIMSQEQQDALQDIAHSTLMQSDEEEDINKMVDRNATINKNNFL